jgi:hypothetical protein
MIFEFLKSIHLTMFLFCLKLKKQEDFRCRLYVVFAFLNLTEKVYGKCPKSDISIGFEIKWPNKESGDLSAFGFFARLIA